MKLLISSKGTILQCNGDDMHEAILIEITRVVGSLPEKWSPAKADFRKFAYDFYDEDDEEIVVLIPANSWVRLQFWETINLSSIPKYWHYSLEQKGLVIKKELTFGKF